MNNDKRLDEFFENKLKGGENHRLFQTEVEISKEDAEEIASLLSFAATIEEVLHPRPSPAATGAARVRLLRVANEISIRNISRPASSRAWLFRLPTRAMALFFIFLLITGVGFWWYGPVSAHSATMADANGTVEVASLSNEDWQAVSIDETVPSGSRIRTGAAGSATLVFFEGTRITLEPNSEITLASVSGKWGNVLQVELSQQSGLVHYNITPFSGTDGKFSIKTPAGLASVKGTNFEVTIRKEGQTLVSVDQGAVEVANAGGVATVLAGEAVISEPGNPPNFPEYRFSLNSTLTAIDGSTWKLSDIPILINKGTQFTAYPQIGQPIFVTGRITQNKQWVADSVDLGQPSTIRMDIVGVAQAVGADVWTLSGMSFRAPNALITAEKIQNGDRILTELSLGAENQWQAEKITNLGKNSDNSRPTCVGDANQPKAEILAEKYGVSYGDVADWACQGFGYGEIDLAYEMSQHANIAVTDIFEMRRQPLGWGEVRSKLQVTLLPSFITHIVSTPTLPSENVIVTPTVIAGVSPVPLKVSNRACSSSEPQPEAQLLANHYGVESDEIMSWFCNGFGFGEIRLAYDINKLTGSEVEKLFAMKKLGLGWGDIQKIANQEKIDKNNKKIDSNNSNNGNNSNNANADNNGNNGNKTDKTDKTDKTNNGNNGNTGNNGNSGNNSDNGNSGNSGNSGDNANPDNNGKNK